jgi:carboxypeptidase family protein/TonB-dependent receptor-like protein
MLSKRILTIAVSLLLLLTAQRGASAQLGTAAITGSVFDTNGAAIGQATVVATNKATGHAREARTSALGLYTLQTLQPTVYELKIKAQGFAEAVIGEVEARVGEVVTVNVTLRAAGASETVEIAASEAQGVDTTTTQVAGFVPGRFVRTLPLNGRNFLDLAFLLPGNSPAPNFDPTKTKTVEITSAGQSGRGGNVAVDGADNNDDFSGGTLQNFPLDAVQEFQIITDQSSAEVGHSGSSAVNVITKSGTNELHGSAAFFFRNARLSALPATLDRQSVRELGRPPFDRQQYAASFGGPIKRDRAWFFGAFEYRNQDAILIAGERRPLSRTITTTFSPAPLGDLLFTARADWQTGQKDRMVFRYALEDDDQVETSISTIPKPINTASHSQKSFNKYHSLVYNYLHTFSPRLANDFVAQYSHFQNRIPKFVDQPELLFPSIADGHGGFIPQATRQRRFQLRDNVSLMAGAHALKFGGEFHRISYRAFYGFFTQGTVLLTEDFATRDRNRDGQINDFDIPVEEAFRAVADSDSNTITYRNNYFAVYAQDNWKLGRGFNVNLGLRYEIETNSKDTDFFDDLSPIARPFLAPGRRRRDRDNLGPRIGFNWSPGSLARTAIHGGFGIYYHRIPVNVTSSFERLDSRALRIFVTEGSHMDDGGDFIRGTATLQNPFTGALIPTDFLGLYVIDKNFEHPTVQQFSLGVRHELARDLILSVDGIHTFGTKFFLARPVGAAFDPLIGADTTIFNIESSGKNWYDGLLVSVEKRAAGRLGFLASYTLSKALNYSQDDLNVSIVPVIDPNNFRLEKGPAAGDQRHRFTLAGTVGVPYGVTIAPILTLASSVPFNILLPDGATRVPLLQRNAGARLFRRGSDLNAFIREVNAGGGASGFGALPFVRDDLRLGDRFSSLDLRVQKNFKLSERINLQAIVEAFNLFNVTNIRGFDVESYSGFQNALVRDSEDPADRGFLRSSTFGASLQTAGGVFGTGGPRAFQLAVRLSF